MNPTRKNSHNPDQLQTLTSAAVQHAKARKARALSELELAETVGGAAISAVLIRQIYGFFPIDILQTLGGVVSPIDVQGGEIR